VFELPVRDPLQLVAAVGDPMQVAVEAIASRSRGVMLAGGKCWLLCPIQAISRAYDLAWQPEQVVVGTTRW